MTAQELVDRRAAEHDETERTLVVEGVTWRRVHTMRQGDPSKPYYELWSYLGHDKDGGLYHYVFDIPRMVRVYMPTLDVSFYGGMRRNLITEPDPAGHRRIRSARRIYAWLRHGETVQIPEATEFRCGMINFRKIVSRYINDELCETAESP